MKFWCVAHCSTVTVRHYVVRRKMFLRILMWQLYYNKLTGCHITHGHVYSNDDDNDNDAKLIIQDRAKLKASN